MSQPISHSPSISSEASVSPSATSLRSPRSAGEPGRSSRAAIWIGRILSTLIVLFMLLDGVMKIAMVESVVKASAEVGIPEFALRGIGITLVVCTILYAIPMTSVLGAILLTGYLGGAVLTQVRLGSPAFSILMPPIFGAIAWLGLYLREARLRALVPFRSSH